MNSLKLAIAQHRCSHDIDINLNTSLTAIRDAASKGAQLVVLPELHRSLYFCQQENTSQFDLAETIPGPSTETFGALAKELGIVIVCSLFEKRATGLYHNTAVVLEQDGTIAGSYRKMHIPDDPGFYEKFYFTPGDKGFTPIETSLGKLGVLVCWDQWFPEAARLMAMAGADILIYPTAIGWDPNDEADEQQRQLDAWITVQRGHAIANGLPVVSVNRHGHEADPNGGKGTLFWGNSFVTGPQGELLYKANSDESTTAVVNIDMARSESIRRIWPFLRDRRVDAYNELSLIYRD